MKPLIVKTETKEYPIYIKEDFDDLLNSFAKNGIKDSKICIISDSNVKEIYLDKILELLNKEFSEVSSYCFKAGETSKNLETIKEFYEFFIQEKLDRNSVVVALGGGVTGDMAGFAAATFMRGVRFVQIPTTLLSQVDSSVGGKVGVDFMGSKNMIGAFYQPEFVYINSKTLDTLPKNEFSAGMAEVIKYGYIADESYLKYIEKNKRHIKECQTDAIQNIIYRACEIKAEVVSQDEKETGLREILNFGHTFGHAVESLSDFSMLHGECVAVGMAAALYLSAERGDIEYKDVEFLTELLDFFDLESVVKGFETKNILNQMLYDKKNKDNKINLILIRKIGEAYTEKNAVSSEIEAAVNYILSDVE